jgi:hypothetical protein
MYMFNISHGISKNGWHVLSHFTTVYAVDTHRAFFALVMQCLVYCWSVANQSYWQECTAYLYCNVLSICTAYIHTAYLYCLSVLHKDTACNVLRISTACNVLPAMYCLQCTDYMYCLPCRLTKGMMEQVLVECTAYAY